MFDTKKHPRVFITGTNTEVGKTYCTSRLLEHFNKQGLKTLGLKPIASGGHEDAIELQKHSSIEAPLELINPICFEPAIAPHIAANEIHFDLSVSSITNALQPGIRINTDITLIEGAGGLLVPLNKEETLTDLIKALNIPVILVSHMTLGCLNHTLLTVNELKRQGIELLGWIANTMQKPMPYLRENMQTLENTLGKPLKNY